MPRMDGFTFLRILMAKAPTPVIVVSSYSQRENVFKALELGALDFVPKPDRLGARGHRGPRGDPAEGPPRPLAPAVVRARRRSCGARRAARSRPTARPRRSTAQRRRDARTAPPKQVVAIASSTGGPSALLQLFAQAPGDHDGGVPRRAAHARQVHAHVRRAPRQARPGAHRRGERRRPRRAGHGLRLPGPQVHGARTSSASSSRFASGRPRRPRPLRPERRPALQERRAARARAASASS